MVLSSVFSRNGCFSPFAISPGTRKGPSRSPLFYFFRNIDRWDPSGSHTRRCSVLLRLTELHTDCLLCFTDLCVCFTFTPGGPVVPLHAPLLRQAPASQDMLHVPIQAKKYPASKSEVGYFQLLTEAAAKLGQNEVLFTSFIPNFNLLNYRNVTIQNPLHPKA